MDIINGTAANSASTTKDCKVLVVQYQWTVGSTSDNWDYVELGLYRDSQLINSTRSHDNGQNQYAWTVTCVFTNVPSGTVFSCDTVPVSYYFGTLKSWCINLYQVY